ncbi:unnamed protein product [Paramecium sonneborni]|uniref:Uncharacterized protein n=1 Tax=Paramecium sonneborni TaxID=65129 RepID=A0A8S1RS53_9CILI|nr:unnamed protein product [Paramecium sonneborni]
MNLSNQNPNCTLKATNWEGQAIEQEVEQWDQTKCKFHKINIGIKYTQDNQIIYSKNEIILRVVKVHDILENPQLFNNMDQIQNLSWQGQYGKNEKKEGKWVAFWDKNILKNVGGYFNNGQKEGQWKDLFLNYCDQAKVVETGLYFKSLRIGIWNYIFKDMKISGGLYNVDGQKQGKWIVLDERFFNYKQVTYNGEYNCYGMKIGRWDIMYKYVDKYGIEREYKQIGGGTYGQKGNQIKIGKWIELDEEFTFDKQVAYIGEYNNNGKKVGRWDIMFYKYGVPQDQQIGGGLYDLEGNQKKIGKWIELDEGYSLDFVDSKEVTYIGEYDMNGRKIGRWDILYRNKQIGGGLYDLEGNQKKIGKWILQDKQFKAIKQITYTGEYNINGIKVGRWDIMFTKSIDQPYQQIGGGSYDQEGNQIKIGKWIEQDNFFLLIKQITYNGEYNIKGRKVGRWDIWFQRLFGDKYEQIGGGFYDQKGSQKKIGNWVDLDEKFQTGNEITHTGEYNINGMKVCRWDILFRNKQIRGGSYDQEGNEKKIGKWIELDEYFNSNKSIYNGEYNMNGTKVGRWDIMYHKLEREYIQIGGGSFDQEGTKFGKWTEITKSYEVTYNGEYNKNGVKVGTWIEMSINDNKKLREIQYDN